MPRSAAGGGGEWQWFSRHPLHWIKKRDKHLYLRGVDVDHPTSKEFTIRNLISTLEKWLPKYVRTGTDPRSWLLILFIYLFMQDGPNRATDTPFRFIKIFELFFDGAFVSPVRASYRLSRDDLLPIKRRCPGHRGRISSPRDPKRTRMVRARRMTDVFSYIIGHTCQSGPWRIPGITGTVSARSSTRGNIDFDSGGPRRDGIPPPPPEEVEELTNRNVDLSISINFFF